MIVDFMEMDSTRVERVIPAFISRMSPDRRLYLCHEVLNSAFDQLVLNQGVPTLAESVVHVARKHGWQRFIAVATNIQSWEGWTPSLRYVRLAYVIAKYLSPNELKAMCAEFHIEYASVDGQSQEGKALAFAILMKQRHYTEIDQLRARLETLRQSINWSFVQAPLNEYLPV